MFVPSKLLTQKSKTSFILRTSIAFLLSVWHGAKCLDISEAQEGCWHDSLGSILDELETFQRWLGPGILFVLWLQSIGFGGPDAVFVQCPNWSFA